MNQTQKGVSMYKNVAAFRRLALMVIILALAALACNFQTGDLPEEPSPTSTSTSTSVNSSTEGEAGPTAGPSPTLAPPETLPANFATEASPLTATLIPTFTPVQVPTLAQTLTPTATAMRRATATRSSVQPPGTASGPLAFDYSINWRLADASALQAIATVILTATGGGGGYRYYRDIDEVEATFEYIWATCRGNPTTFRVTSASGESVEQVVFFHPPCPTATPFS
jgi:hypothetical protein